MSGAKMSCTVLVQMYPQTDCRINGGVMSNLPDSGISEPPYLTFGC